jgi:predicted aspartyl protease
LRLLGEKLDRFNRGFIEALIFTPKFNILSPVDFLVDTGAAKTTISASDAKSVGINPMKLRRSAKPVISLGGDVKARHLGKCQLVFRRHNTEIVEHLDDILVLEETKIQNSESPSLLGMDVLKNYIIKFIDGYIIIER